MTRTSSLRLVGLVLIAGALASIGTALQALPQSKTARIAGVVARLDTGESIKGVLVSVRGAVSVGFGQALTDDEGRFEFDQLPAGEYRLSAVAEHFSSPDATNTQPGAGVFVEVADRQQLENVRITMSLLGGLEGAVIDEVGKPMADVQIELLIRREVAGRAVFIPTPQGHATTRTDKAGRYRFVESLLAGDYYASASPEKAGYGTTFFPAADRAWAAQAVHVDLGVQTRGVDFALAPVALVTLSGTVFSPSGQGTTARVRLYPTHNGDVTMDAGMSADTDPKGGFTLKKVPVGSYVLQGFADDGFVSRPVDVGAGEPIAGLDLFLKPLVTARGRVVFEGGAPPPAKSVTVRFVPTNFTTGPGAFSRLAVTPDASWAFEFPHLAWIGLFRVDAPGWALKRVLLNGKDIVDEPSDFQSADVNGLGLVMTNRLGSISGRVVDGDKPATIAGVVALPENLTTLGLASRLKGILVQPDGTFTISDLLPGKYRLLAISTAQDPTSDSLAAMASTAPLVLVEEGKTVTMSVRLIRR